MGSISHPKHGCTPAQSHCKRIYSSGVDHFTMSDCYVWGLWGELTVLS